MKTKKKKTYKEDPSTCGHYVVSVSVYDDMMDHYHCDFCGRQWLQERNDPDGEPITLDIIDN